MLKEDPRYDYVESAEADRPTVSRVRRSKGRRGISLPVGTRMTQMSSSLPMQSYLQQRFPHIGGKDLQQRLLRAENQRRYNRAAALGRFPMSRTS